MDGLAASTIKVRLSAVRRLVAEASHAGMLDAEKAARLSDVPNIRERGTRLGNWLAKGGKVWKSLSEWAGWDIVQQAAGGIGIEDSEISFFQIEAKVSARSADRQIEGVSSHAR